MEKKITARQYEAIQAILTTSSRAEAAQASGIPLRTIENWEKLEHFQAALDAAQNAVNYSAEERMISDKLLAVSAMEDVMDNPAQPGAALKLRAAERILDWGIRFQEKAERKFPFEEEYVRLHIKDRMPEPANVPILRVFGSDGTVATTQEEIQKLLKKEIIYGIDKIDKLRKEGLGNKSVE